MIDLTLTISKSTKTFPGSPEPAFIPWSFLDKDGYNLELLFMSSHTGTHIDAPYHFASHGLKVNQIPLTRLVGTAILFHIPYKKNNAFAITKDDIIRLEKDVAEKGYTLDRNSSIVFHTGWQKIATQNNFFTQNPGLDRSAAKYLASKGISLVGIDSPSIDLGTNSSFVAHHILADAGVLIVENLVNLEKIHSDTFDFVMLPLKLKGASGSPIRALAV